MNSCCFQAFAVIRHFTHHHSICHVLPVISIIVNLVIFFAVSNSPSTEYQSLLQPIKINTRQHVMGVLFACVSEKASISHSTWVCPPSLVTGTWSPPL